MTNYYEILGIKQNASHDDIKRAYKKLAVKHHPDKGGDEKTFQKISNAYNVLSDAQKRQNYDRTGDENSQHMNMNPHEMFAQFFNRGMKQQPPVNKKCNDIIHNYNISLRQAFTGINKQIRIKTKAYNFDKVKQCDNCQGIGRIKNIKNMGGIFTQIFETECNTCKGSGFIEIDEHCSYEIEKIINLNVPKGVKDGFTIIHNGLGEQPKSKNGIPGDIVFKIHIEPNDVFQRKDNDLYSSVKIDFISSITGANIHFNIMDEEYFEFNTSQFNIVYPNKKYKIEKKGMIFNNSQRGDLYLDFNIDYPVLNNMQRERIRESFRAILADSNDDDND